VSKPLINPKLRRTWQKNRIERLQRNMDEFLEMCEDGFLCTKAEARLLAHNMRYDISKALEFLVKYGYLDVEE
jgi:hypothetical protein